VENITLGQISNLLVWIITFFGAVGTIATTIIVFLNKIIKKQLKPINEKIDKLDLNDCKNFLVRFLADVERGQAMDDVELKRAHDVYDHYRDDLHANSYIKDKWEKLMK